MALIDFAPASRSPIASVACEAWSNFAGLVTAWHAERTRHLAFRDLLTMEPHRLHDLGISVFDVKQAMRRAHRTMTELHGRRAGRQAPTKPFCFRWV